MKIIKDGDLMLARYIESSDIKEGLNFFSEDHEYIQTGAWNYSCGKVLPAHIHNKVDRKIDKTNEVIYVIQGKLKAKIYSLEEQLIEEIIVNEGEMLVLLEGGHGYEILQDDTKVLEVKNGPYLGAEVDRHRI